MMTKNGTRKAKRGQGNNRFDLLNVHSIVARAVVVHQGFTLQLLDFKVIIDQRITTKL